VNEFLVVINAVLPVFTVAGAGFGLRRLEWLTEEADKSMLKLLINLLVPCLIFDSVLGNKALTHLGTVILAPVVGFGTVALGVFICWLLRGAAGLTDKSRHGTFAFVTGIYNYGYVPLPLVYLLFKDSPDMVGLLLVHNVGVEIAMWTLGLMLLSGVSIKAGWRKLINAPISMILISLVLNLAGAEHWMPKFIIQTAHMLGQCAIPIGILLVGATIADQLPEFHAEKGWRVMAASSFLRLAILPVLFVLLAKYLPCSVELKRIIVIQGAMPAAVFPIIMARHYGGHAPTALRIVIGTTVLGLVTIPLWIKLGLWFIES
jgi:malate permease and related proteins